MRQFVSPVWISEAWLLPANQPAPSDICQYAAAFHFISRLLMKYMHSCLLSLWLAWHAPVKHSTTLHSSETESTCVLSALTWLIYSYTNQQTTKTTTKQRMHVYHMHRSNKRSHPLYPPPPLHGGYRMTEVANGRFWYVRFSIAKSDGIRPNHDRSPLLLATYRILAS